MIAAAVVPPTFTIAKLLVWPTPVTCTGDDLLIVVLSPSVPVELLPQAHSFPVELIAAVNEVLLLTKDQLLVPTCVGELLLIVSFRPKFPLAFSPQAQSLPSVVIPCVELSPAETIDQLLLPIFV